MQSMISTQQQYQRHMARKSMINAKALKLASKRKSRSQRGRGGWARLRVGFRVGGASGRQRPCASGDEKLYERSASALQASPKRKTFMRAGTAARDDGFRYCSARRGQKGKQLSRGQSSKYTGSIAISMGYRYNADCVRGHNAKWEKYGPNGIWKPLNTNMVGAEGGMYGISHRPARMHQIGSYVLRDAGYHDDEDRDLYGLRALLNYSNAPMASRPPGVPPSRHRAAGAGA
eukprot:2419238-Pleurochrysis_carterae.AAC.4